MKKILAPILSVIILVGVTLGVFFIASARDTTYTLSIGVHAVEDLANSKISYTAAVIVSDDAGKIVTCRIDTVDYTASIDQATGKLKVVKPQTKMELGSNYGMVDKAHAIAEWDAQAKHFESYVVGMTRENVLAISENLTQGNAPADLIAGCTMQSSVKDFKVAIQKAFDSQHKTRFKATDKFTVGLAINTSLADNTTDGDVLANVKYGYAGVVKSGNKYVSAILDETDVTMQITLNADNTIASTAWASRVTTMSKLEQGDNYGMVAWGKASGEWYAQAQNYANTIINRTAQTVADLPTENVTGCTIYMGGMKQTLLKAASNVR